MAFDIISIVCYNNVTDYLPQHIKEIHPMAKQIAITSEAKKVSIGTKDLWKEGKAKFVSTYNSKEREITLTLRRLMEETSTRRIDVAEIDLTYFGGANAMASTTRSKSLQEDAKEITELVGQNIVPVVEALTDGPKTEIRGYRLLTGYETVMALKAAGNEQVVVKTILSHKLNECGTPYAQQTLAVTDMLRIGANVITLTEKLRDLLIGIAGLEGLTVEDATTKLISFYHKTPDLAPSAVRAITELFQRIGKRSADSFFRNNLRTYANLPAPARKAVKEGKKSLNDFTRKPSSPIHEQLKAIIKLTKKSGKRMATKLGNQMSAEIQALSEDIERKTKQLAKLIDAQAAQGFAPATT